MTPEATRIWKMHAKYLSKAQIDIRVVEAARGKLGRFIDDNRRCLGVAANIFSAWCAADLVTKGGLGNGKVSDVGRANLRRYLGKTTRAQHQLIGAQVVQNGERIQVNHAQSALDWLRRHRKGAYVINDVDYRAAMRLQSDFDRIGQQASLTMSWAARTDCSPKTCAYGDREITAVEAQRRIHDALHYVGPGLSEVLVATCRHHDSLQNIERDFAYPSRSAKIIIKLALVRLSVFYGFQSEEAASASLRMR